MTMNTKPKKFRLRKSGSLVSTPETAPTEKTEDSNGPANTPERPPRAEVRVTKRAPDAQRIDSDLNTDLAAIRREGLTGRQLRMARRLAQKHDVPVTSDFDAVRQLRLKGIDPFERANMLELVVPDSQSPATTKTDPKVQLPQTVKPTKVPSNDLRPEVKPKAPESSGQLLQIQEIQRERANA